MEVKVRHIAEYSIRYHRFKAAVFVHKVNLQIIFSKRSLSCKCEKSANHGDTFCDLDADASFREKEEDSKDGKLDLKPIGVI